RPAMNGESRPAGRPARITPIYETQKARGAFFEEAHGWERPKWFSLDGRSENYSFQRNNIFDVVANECEAVRHRVGVIDISSFSNFKVSGQDTMAFLGSLCANKLPKTDGRIGLTQVLNESGRIFSEWTVTRLNATSCYLTTGAMAEIRDFDHLERHCGDWDVTLENLSSKTGVLVIAGPDARRLLSELTESDLSNDGFKWLSAQQIDIAGISVLAMRVNYVGELGWELHVAIDRLNDLYAAITRSGEPYGLADVGLYAMNSMRLEKAYHGWGHELTNEMDLVQAGMMRFCNLDHDFIGRMATQKAQQTGPDSKIVYCEVDSNGADALGGETCWSNGKTIGTVTSGGYGHRTAKSLAFAWVHSSCIDIGATFEIDILGIRCRATALGEPVYDPGNLAIKS
ncbi:MAG: aminomethyl transferase family protein, partial [Hyphomicrobiales bacterium]|nr:aminomethyl transferase family protein [Hyphomicrobiales bacterium]